MSYTFSDKINKKGDWLCNPSLLFNERIDSTFSVLHYYNDIKYTKWPFLLSLGIVSLLAGVLLSFSKFSFGAYALFFGIVSVCGYLFGWFDELHLEARLLGKHTKKIKSALLCGFFLFLFSEATLFAGFFWSLLDRIFSASSFISFSSFPSGLERIEWYRDPLRATVVLVASGYMANLAYYNVLDKNRYASDFYWGLSIFFGLCFLYIQYKEYCHLQNDIRDSVWYSHMYVLTGFHGFHVIVGLLFLSYRFSSFENENVDNMHRRFDIVFWYNQIVAYVQTLFVHMQQWHNTGMGKQNQDASPVPEHRTKLPGITDSDIKNLVYTVILYIWNLRKLTLHDVKKKIHDTPVRVRVVLQESKHVFNRMFSEFEDALRNIRAAFKEARDEIQHGVRKAFKEKFANVGLIINRLKEKLKKKLKDLKNKVSRR